MKNVFLTIAVAILFSPCVSGQWNPDPEMNFVLMSGNIMSVKSVQTANNRTFVSWFYKSGRSNNYDLYVQLLDVNGYKLWDEPGLLISSHPQDTLNVEEQVMLCDKDDNLVIVFSDFRENAMQGLVCYKLNQEGEFLWGPDGLRIIANPANNSITSISAYCDSTNDIIVSAGIYSQSNNVFFQRITSDKVLPWGINGKFITNAEHAKVFSTGEKIMFLFKEKTGNYPQYLIKLLYQFFDKDGNAIFADHKIVSDAGGIAFWDAYDAIMTDNHHLVVAWHDDRNHDGLELPYAQRIDEEGNTLWENNGIVLSTEPAVHHLSPLVVGKAPDNSTILIWQKTIAPFLIAVYRQKVDENGNILWGLNGQELLPECFNFNKIESSVIDNENFYVSYGLHPTEGIYDTVHYMIGSYGIEDGAANWTQPVSFAASPAPKDFLTMRLIPGVQLVTTWREGAFTINQEVRAQNIGFDGTLGTMTSVSDIEQNSLSIFPNPASDYIQINYNGSDIKTVLIEDIFGNIVYSQMVNMRNPVIKISHLNNGLYFVKLQTNNNRTFVSKIVRK